MSKKLNKYKVEFTYTAKYVVDVRAKDEANAEKLAKQKYLDIHEAGMQHYHQTDNPTVVQSAIYDVTHTDDPFNT